MTATLAGRDCVVLGGGGFLGTNLCRRLVAEGARVRAFGRTRQFPDAMKGVTWTAGPFEDAAAVASSIEGAELVFHLVSASTPATAEVDRAHDLRVNVGGTLSVLEACRTFGVRRVVFASTGGTVYGASASPPFAEDLLPQPITTYGINKLTIEHYMRLYNERYGMRNVVLRIANPFGPFQTGHRHQGAVAVFLRRAFLGQQIEIWGDGSVVRDYIYVDDVVEALVRAATYRGTVAVLNVGGGAGRSLMEVLRGLEAAAGIPFPRRHLPARPIDVPVSVLDIRAAAEHLGWAPRTPWEDGLARTADWLRGHMVARGEIEP